VIGEAPPEHAAEVVRQGAGSNYPDNDQHYSDSQEKQAKYSRSTHRVTLLNMSDLTRSSHMVPIKNVTIKTAAKTPKIKNIIILAPFPINE
jgi:hypothetical protein